MRWLVLLILGLFVKAAGNPRVDSLQKLREGETVQDPDPEFVAMVEAKVMEHYKYILDCYDVQKKEGLNVMQWLFGATIGGLGLVGSLAKAGYWPLAGGAFVAACWSAWHAARLIGTLNSKEIVPPGNSSEVFKKMRDEGNSVVMMRWREVRGISLRAQANTEVVQQVATFIDLARTSLSFLSAIFLSATAIAWSAERLYKVGVLKPVGQLLGF